MHEERKEYKEGKADLSLRIGEHIKSELHTPKEPKKGEPKREEEKEEEPSLLLLLPPLLLLFLLLLFLLLILFLLVSPFF